MAVPDAIPHMKDSRTHHLKGEFWMLDRIPPYSGRKRVQVAVSGAASFITAASVSGILFVLQKSNYVGTLYFCDKILFLRQEFYFLDTT